MLRSLPPLLCLGVAAFLAMSLAPRPATAQVTFLIEGSGKIAHHHNPAPGAKPFKTNVKQAQIISCILGNEPSCLVGTPGPGGGMIETDAGGQAYLIYVARNFWQLATNSAGTNATDLNGFVAPDGSFMMYGQHAGSAATLFLTGKVKFQKGTLVPTEVSGKILAVAQTQEHVGSGKFKTTGIAP
jgi:hypothetical protein